MTISVYPSYVGPTLEYRYASLYPQWLGNIIGGVVPPELEEWLGGVLVLDEQYAVAAMGSALTTLCLPALLDALSLRSALDALERTSALDVSLANNNQEVETLAGKIVAFCATVTAGVTEATPPVDVAEKNEFEAEISDEEPKI
jgi:hypothetical protein